LEEADFLADVFSTTAGFSSLAAGMAALATGVATFFSALISTLACSSSVFLTVSIIPL
jgi:X-X-X-Leu-X-X-Gly heptad repeat protein